LSSDFAWASQILKGDPPGDPASSNPDWHTLAPLEVIRPLESNFRQTFDGKSRFDVGVRASLTEVLPTLGSDHFSFDDLVGSRLVEGKQCHE